MNDSAPKKIPVKWDGLVLVCKACRKRDNGPEEFKPRDIASEAKRAGKEARSRLRVVQTGCLGLCPKRATAVAMVQNGLAERPYLLVVRQAGETAAALADAGRKDR